MLSPGATLELLPEKPVVGGRMLARVGGEVVLVTGTIPGERVVARLDRRNQGVWFASTLEVIEASPDRRDAGPDPACGGMGFAHIAYPRQCELKIAVTLDALLRVGRVRPEAPVSLTESPTEGYRMRYRVHADEGRLGFFREGTHVVCDPAPSGQLARASLACLEALGPRLPPARGGTGRGVRVRGEPAEHRARGQRGASRPRAGALRSARRARVGTGRDRGLVDGAGTGAGDRLGGDAVGERFRAGAAGAERCRGSG